MQSEAFTKSFFSSQCPNVDPNIAIDGSFTDETCSCRRPITAKKTLGDDQHAIVRFGIDLDGRKG
jgi:hypothetical protein